MPVGYSLEQRLIDAVFLDDLEEIREVLTLGAGTEGRDEEHRTPLLAATLAGNAAIVRLLLEAGGNPDARDDDGWTALHVAAHRQRLDLTWMLLRAGADPNAQDEDGNSVLWRATLTSLGRPEVVELLRRHGARSDLPNQRGLSAGTMARHLLLPLERRATPRPS